MNLRKWIRERWTEIRWGFSNYLSLAVTFTNLVLLVALKFIISGVDFIFLALSLFVGLTALSGVLGYMHRKLQQDTDALLTNKAVLDEIRKIVREELEKEE